MLWFDHPQHIPRRGQRRQERSVVVGIAELSTVVRVRPHRGSMSV
jgi:hypothetical protein